MDFTPTNVAAQAQAAEEQKAPETQVITDTELTDEVIEAIKAKAAEIKAEKKIKRIYPIVVKGDEYDEKPLYVGYFKRPNFATFSMFMNKVQSDSAQASRMLAQNCFVDGDKELISDDDLFLYGLMNQLTVLVDNRHAELVKA